MNQQRDAILGYAQDLQTYYIQFIENNLPLANRYGLICDGLDEDQAEHIMTTLILKKSFWLNGSTLHDIIQGLLPMTESFMPKHAMA